MKKPVSILIIEDNRRYTESLKRMIQLTDGMTLAADYHDGEQFRKELNEEVRRETEVIILDLNLPGDSGLELLPMIREEIPQGQILVLTQKSDHQSTLEAIRLGASGYLLKKSSIAIIREAIFEVHGGGCLIDPKLSKAMLKAMDHPSLAAKEKMLTEREEQVLELLAQGLVKKEVAEQMAVSYSSVAQYTEAIYKKLQVSNVAAAVATAIRKGLI